MTKGIKGFQKGRIVSEETRRKIGKANKGIWIKYNCDYCKKPSSERQSHYKRKKRHFCSVGCYSLFRKYRLPKTEQHAYKGGGLPEKEKVKRIKARSAANHALRDGKIKKLPCEACGRKDAQMHHHDYSKPLEVKWLCVKCHWEEHKIIYETPELLNQ